MKKSNSQKIKVLHLSRWYPNRYDPMPGLFIQRHAEAVSKHCDVGMVYVHPAENSEQTQYYELQLERLNQVLTARVYYKVPSKKFLFLDKPIKIYRFYRANRIGIRAIKTELKQFDLIHVHILTRLGLIAFYHRFFFNIPYIISEHWSRYLPLTNEFNGAMRKWITRFVVKNAAVVTTVTKNLANAMQTHGLKNDKYHTLSNVVTDTFFNTEKTDAEKPKVTFLHVSCFEDKSKNISGLLHVILSLSKKRNDFTFKMIGEGMDFDFLKKYAKDLGIPDKMIDFTGLLEGEELVRQMASTDLMVVFSNYENFPVVINESFALGIPVLATKVGGIPEYINETNGRLLEAGDQQGLEDLLINYLDGQLKFDRERIMASSQSQFSSDGVGNELFQLYREAIKKPIS